MTRTQASRWWEHRLPPPLIDGGCALLMMWLAHVLPAAQLWPRGGPTWAQVLALLLVGLGAAVALAGLLAFRRARTTFNPLTPERSSVLVTGGIYRITRNPMYLGMLLVLAGWGVWLGNAASWIALPLSMALLTRLQIAPEERILRARFGAAFDAYAARVRRWL